ncbi:MAG: methyltransferase-like protein 9 [Flavobacteriales bacterium]|nr:methyltransferase-like protein 9 [Flavobacteriales bacterium]MCX7650364.1 methyltransferase-like protein 9 [Flavobacteriales bacterium]MDW8432385.1 hypothetical protein [Flavobacteriales bacterium]
MKKIIKKLIPSFIYKWYSDRITEYYKRNPDEWREAVWEKEGKPNPPPHIIKYKTILKHLKRSPVQIFIETGTYMGEMVERVAPHFRHIFTIELDAKLHERAQKKFLNMPHIHCLQGDSAEVLHHLLLRSGWVSEPVAFWLVGHYSGGITARAEKVTPILKELESIHQYVQQNAQPVFIFIDDAHLFNGTDDYPTLEQMVSFQRHHFPTYSHIIENNIIIWMPPGS